MVASTSSSTTSAPQAACVLYEITFTRGGATIGKSITGLQVLDADRPRRLSWRQSFIRWLLVAGVQPLIWLSLLLGGDESTQARILIAAALGASLLWRATLGLSILASSGTSSIHDRAARSTVLHARH